MRAGSSQSTRQKRARVVAAAAPAVAATPSRSRPAANWTVEFEMSDPVGITEVELSVIELFLGSAVDLALERARSSRMSSFAMDGGPDGIACARSLHESESTP